MPDPRSEPIYIVSSPRSGSTLLRLILDNHPNIAIPPPGYLFNLIYPYLYSYGDLARDENFRELIEDILEAPTIKRWPIDLSVEQILGDVGERTFAAIYEYLHVTYATSHGKIRWGQKSPRNGCWMVEIQQLFPGAKFIHLLRDGRDVAIDLADANFWPNTVFGGALRWQECVRATRHGAAELSPGSYIEIRYEEFCAEPEQTLRDLCAFLGEDFVPALLHHHESEATQSWSQDAIHAKTSRPITTDYVDMYKTRLPDRDREAIEAVIGDTLKDAGYPVEGKPEPLPYRAAAQLIEAEMVSGLDKFQYKTWHKNRRKERQDRGVWRDSERESFLWGFN
jgi:hypothetical protein